MAIRSLLIPAGLLAYILLYAALPVHAYHEWFFETVYANYTGGSQCSQSVKITRPPAIGFSQYINSTSVYLNSTYCGQGNTIELLQAIPFSRASTYQVVGEDPLQQYGVCEYADASTAEACNQFQQKYPGLAESQIIVKVPNGYTCGEGEVQKVYPESFIVFFHSAKVNESVGVTSVGDYYSMWLSNVSSGFELESTCMQDAGSSKEIAEMSAFDFAREYEVYVANPQNACPPKINITLPPEVVQSNFGALPLSLGHFNVGYFSLCTQGAEVPIMANGMVSLPGIVAQQSTSFNYSAALDIVNENLDGSLQTTELWETFLSQQAFVFTVTSSWTTCTPPFNYSVGTLGMIFHTNSTGTKLFGQLLVLPGNSTFFLIQPPNGAVGNISAPQCVYQAKAPIVAPQVSPTSSPIPSSVSPSPSPSVTASPNNDDVCFSASSLIRVMGKGVVQLLDVQVGDKVQSFDEEHHGLEYSEVILVQHEHSDAKHKILVIDYSSQTTGQSGTLRVTPRHYVYMSTGANQMVHIRAQDLQVGDELIMGFKTKARITSIGEGMDQVRNIHTMNDRAVIDGVFVSCFAANPVWGGSLDVPFLKALILPFKYLYRMELVWMIKVLDGLIHNIHKYIQ